MTTIDEIMRAAMTLGDQRLMATHNRATSEDVLEAEAAMRNLIAAALADAERKGAEAMRDAIAVECSRTYTIPVPRGDVLTEEERECYPNGMKANWIRAMPLPTGSQQ